MKHALFALSLAVATLGSAHATPLDIGTRSQGGCCDSMTRGYWFTAPVDFTIDSLALPSIGQGNNDTLEVLRLNGAPPLWTHTTNDFTSLGYWTGVSSVNTDIAVHAGDVIGVLGWTNGLTPYATANSYATSIGGAAVTLKRLGFQDLGQAHDVWTENAAYAYINMNYTVATRAVPEPATVSLFALGLVALAARRKKRSAR